MMDIKPCCELCAHYDDKQKDKAGIVCNKCNLNKNYISHFKEAPQVTAYKKLLYEVREFSTVGSTYTSKEVQNDKGVNKL